MNAKDNVGFLKVISNSVAKEGPMVFFKGWLPAWIRLQPTSEWRAECGARSTQLSTCIGRADTSHPHLPHARAAQGWCGPLPQGRRYPPVRLSKKCRVCIRATWRRGGRGVLRRLLKRERAIVIPWVVECKKYQVTVGRVVVVAVTMTCCGYDCGYGSQLPLGTASCSVVAAHLSTAATPRPLARVCGHRHGIKSRVGYRQLC